MFNSVPIGQKAKDNSVMRRLEIRNLDAGQHDLYLQLISTKGKSINIPIGKDIPTKPSKDQPPEIGKADVVLVPVTFKRRTDKDGESLTPAPDDLTDIARFPSDVREDIYKDIESHLQKAKEMVTWPQMLSAATKARVNLALQPKRAVHLRRGWLYVYKAEKGSNKFYLWRELKAVKNGKMQEVDLTEFAAKNERAASGLKTSYLELPYKVNNKQYDIAIAFSDVQWSWERINLFGGMDPDDPRNKGQASISKDIKKFKERFEVLDLAPFTKQDVQVNTTTSKTNGITNVRALDKNKVPTVFVSDPIGYVVRLSNDLANSIRKLNFLVSKAEKTPFFRSALLTYQTFFNPKFVHDDGPTKQQKAEIDKIFSEPKGPIEKQYNNWQKDVLESGTPNVFKQNQSNLNRKKIEDILLINERKAVRRKIRLLQSSLLRLIQEPGQPLDPKRYQATNPCVPISVFDYKGVDFFTAINDYFMAAPSYYDSAFIIFGGIQGLLNSDPALIDKSLDIELDYDPKKITQGQAYILDLLTKKNKISKYIFQDKVTFANKDKAKHNEEWSKVFTLDNTSKANASIAGIGADAFKAWIASASKAIEHVSVQVINEVQESVVFFAQLSNYKYIKSIELQEYTEISRSKLPIGYWNKLLKEFVNKSEKDQAAKLKVVNKEDVSITESVDGG